jgi:glycosyltransferase involved in cell wall biosynthesis
MADILREEGITTNIRFFSRGVEHDLFNPGRRDMEWRRSKGIANDEAVVTFVGRIVKEKGLQPFANTIQLLKQRLDGFKVLIVGDGPARDWFAKQVPDAIFTGSLSGQDLATAFASSDIFLNPSVTETFGNVNLEAIASGVAVVGAKASGSNSLITDGVTGLLVPPNDGEEYADAVETLIRDPERRQRMGEAGALASKAYEWNSILAQVADHYLEAVRNYQPQRVLSPKKMPMLKALMKRPGSAEE